MTEEKTGDIAEPTKRQIKIRTYRKGELAELLGLGVKNMARVIKKHEEEFSKLHYNKNQKILSPLQVRKLLEILKVQLVFS